MNLLTQPPPNFQRIIASAIAEAQYASYADVQAVILHLRATLDGTTTEGRDEYRIPPGFTFLGWELHAHLALNSPSTEPTLGTGASTSILEFGGMRERAILKAMNCHFALKNLDATADGLPLLDTTGSSNVASTTCHDGLEGHLRLSTLLPPLGGPVQWAVGRDILPFVARAQQRLRATFKLQETADTRLNRAAEYGIALWGAFIRT